MTSLEKELIQRLQKIAARIVEHGRAAARAGVPIEKNPWKGFSHEFFIWKHGWIYETNQIHSKR